MRRKIYKKQNKLRFKFNLEFTPHGWCIRSANNLFCNHVNYFNCNGHNKSYVAGAYYGIVPVCMI